MVFFKKRGQEEEVKEVEKKEEIEEIKEIVEGVKAPEEKAVEKPAFAPLFVKIDRYRSVLNLLNDLKITVIVIKNAILIQKEVERLGNENRSLIESAINKMDKKILSLDSEFMRPRGFEEEATPTLRESRDLEGVVDDLKKQIGDLKSELKGIT